MIKKGNLFFFSHYNIYYSLFPKGDSEPFMKFGNDSLFYLDI